MTGDPLLAMMLINLFALAGGIAMGSCLLKYYDKKKIDIHSNAVASVFIVAMLIAFAVASYAASATFLVIGVFFAGMSLADSKPEESK